MRQSVANYILAHRAGPSNYPQINEVRKSDHVVRDARWRGLCDACFDGHFGNYITKVLIKTFYEEGIYNWGKSATFNSVKHQYCLKAIHLIGCFFRVIRATILRIANVFQEQRIKCWHLLRFKPSNKVDHTTGFLLPFVVCVGSVKLVFYRALRKFK